MDLLRKVDDKKVKLVASHHPLREHPLDRKRSRTAGGPDGFRELALAGMDLFLHGHLHRHTMTCIPVGSRDVCEVGASTALSDRERFGAAGYNLIDVEERRWELEVKVWRNGAYGTL